MTLPSQFHQTLLLFTVLLAVFVVPSSISGSAIALPFIAKSLGNDAFALSFVVNGFNVFFACFTLIWGALADRFGALKCLRIGALVYLFASLLSAFAPNLFVLDIARALAGIGGGSIFACGSALLILHFESSERIKAFALFGMTAGLGISFSPSISGVLIDIFEPFNFGFNAVFLFHFIVLFVVFILSFLLPKIALKPQEQFDKKAKFDKLGASLFVCFMLSFMLFISRLNALKEPLSLGFGAICVLTFLMFIFHQKFLHKQFITKNANSTPPFLDFTLLSNSAFLGYTLVTVIAGFSFVVLLTYFPSFLIAVLDFSASKAGLFMLALTCPMLFCPFIAGKIIAKGYNAKNLAMIMSLMMSLGLFGLVGALQCSSSIALYVAMLGVLFIIGVGMGLHAGGIDGLALSSVDSSKSGLAAGVLNSFRLGSEAIGVALYFALLLLFIGFGLQSLLGENAIDSITPILIELIANANTAEGLEIAPNIVEIATNNAPRIYQNAFSSALCILGAINLALSALIGRLLRK